MNNAFYGKLLAKSRKRIDFNLVSTKQQLRKLVFSLGWNACSAIWTIWWVSRLDRKTSLTSDLHRLHRTRQQQGDNVRFSWSYAVATYGSRMQLLMTDTDSLQHSVQTTDVMEDLHLYTRIIIHHPDKCLHHPSQSRTKKQAVGLFKNETCGSPIKRVHRTGLRAKC